MQYIFIFAYSKMSKRFQTYDCNHPCRNNNICYPSNSCGNRCQPIFPCPLPPTPGATGATGATGPSGTPGTTGAPGTVGVSGTDGATGVTGSTGNTGAAGSPGLPGASGTTGNTGASGTTGNTGASGTTGATGATGTPGTPGVNGAFLGFADFYAVIPPDNGIQVAVGDAVDFPRDGVVPIDGIDRVSNSVFSLREIGTYWVQFHVCVTDSGQLQLRLNGVPNLTSTVGRSTGTSQIIGNSMFVTTELNTTLEVLNPPEAAIPLTLTLLAGGAIPATAHLIIIRVA